MKVLDDRPATTRGLCTAMAAFGAFVATFLAIALVEVAGVYTMHYIPALAISLVSGWATGRDTWRGWA
jgi:hypothetical protein